MLAEGMSPQLITSILSKDNCWGHGKIRLICPPGFVVKGKDAYGCDGYCVGEDEDAVIVETQRALEQAAYDKQIAGVGAVPREKGGGRDTTTTSSSYPRENQVYWRERLAKGDFQAHQRRRCGW